MKLWLRTFAWTCGARPFTFRILRFLPLWMTRLSFEYVIRPLLDRFLRRFFLIIGKFASYRADAMIDFKRSQASYFEFTFWAFPVSTWPKVVPAYLKFCEEFQRRTGFRPALPTEVYFIRKDNHALLSFSPAEDIFTLDMVDSKPRLPEEEAYWRWMNREYNDFAARHGARPLLNQTKEISRAVVHRALGNDWQTLAKLRPLADPRGRFLNDFFKALL